MIYLLYFFLLFFYIVTRSIQVPIITDSAMISWWIYHLRYRRAVGVFGPGNNQQIFIVTSSKIVNSRFLLSPQALGFFRNTWELKKQIEGRWLLTLVSNEVELVQSQEIGSRLWADKLRKSSAVLVYRRNQIFASSDRHNKIGSNSFQHSTLRFNFYQVIYSSCTEKKKGDPLAKQTANASDGDYLTASSHLQL